MTGLSRPDNMRAMLCGWAMLRRWAVGPVTVGPVAVGKTANDARPNVCRRKSVLEKLVVALFDGSHRVVRSRVRFDARMIPSSTVVARSTSRNQVFFVGIPDSS